MRSSLWNYCEKDEKESEMDYASAMSQSEVEWNQSGQIASSRDHGKHNCNGIKCKTSVELIYIQNVY